jgi:tRNA A-37 threonylcarbamoyl transferase component Bud32
MIGRTVGNYRIVEKLGEGGMGSVYRAVDQMVQRNVAIKALRADLASNPEVSERFHSEAAALAKLNHPCIATLYSFFREGEECFIALEYVPGRNLEQILRASGALEWRCAAAILLRALEGMSHAHAQGIIHRDLKPANIMITPEGGVKLTDFGIARMFYAPRVTRDARVVGTPEYLAPERILAKEADSRSDVYSLGIVFYEMLTGRLPFTSTSDFELMRAHLEEPPKTLGEVGVSVPEPVERCLMLAIEKEPANRLQDAALFSRQLREAVGASGCSIPDLAGVFGVGAKETHVVGTLAPARETVVTPAIAETPIRETVVVAPVAVAAGPMPERTPSKRNLAWLAGGSVMVLLLGVLGVQFRPREHSDAPAPVVSVPDRPAPPLEIAPSVPAPAPSPEPEPPPKPTVTPPKPQPRTARSLAEVKTLYIRPALEEFDTALREQIGHELGGRLEIAQSDRKADAELSVAIVDSRGNRISGAAGRVVGLKGSKKAIATITDASGKQQLWKAEVDDRHNILTPLGDDMKRLASRLAKRLRSDMR